ncbi:TonB-dependent receptor plug domain-containing protein [Roseiarcus sp.]|uniref:TonB-dependent receptor plug domain-containing protein n=1 Tax=Roseiarcus sp. TaxID=1969460 RepID=UPI003F9B7375
MVMLRQPSGWAAAAILLAALQPTLARAQDATSLGDITVTADRVEEPVNASGSDVTVIPGSRIQQWGANGVTEVLREAVGVTVTQNGGPSSLTTVTLRGADAGQVLVMLDGVPIGNVAGTDGSLDFGNLSAVDIDRIEIVRGPQSSLYGSDAMSGVINIITKKGKKGEQRRTVTVEGGSYGTIQGTASVSGSTDNWIYSLGVTDMYTAGFPTYGYRIDRPLTYGYGLGPLPPLPNTMPSDKGAANGALTYTIGPGASVDIGFNIFGNTLQLANPAAVIPSDVFSPYNSSTTWIGNGFIRANATTGILTNHLTVFANTTDSSERITEQCYNAEAAAFDCTNYYRGTRWGAEYQGQLAFGPYGSLIVGARNMLESMNTSESLNPGDGSFTPVGAEQTTNSVYAEYRLPLLSRLDLTFGGRVDAIEDGQTFVTGRTTAAYHIDETGTKLRAAFGNGAKAPTLYQRFSPYGDPNLLSETNVGGEIGIDQKLFHDRLTLSATAYNTFYTNLINFGLVSSCTAQQGVLGGCYYNVGTEQTRGVELTADASLVPDVLHARAGYTYTYAEDTQNDTLQYYVARNSGYLSAVYTGVPNLEIEPRLLLVGPRPAYDFYGSAGNVSLAGYARLDCIVRYKINDTFTAYVRAENLTDTKYELVYDYGTPGVSVYAGLTAKF